jgi:phosphatidylserine decarboxylase
MYFRFHKEISAALIILFLLVIFFYFIYKPLFVASLIILIFTCYFFRDPERVVPLGDDILISPADGLITNISETKDGKKNIQKFPSF